MLTLVYALAYNAGHKQTKQGNRPHSQLKGKKTMSHSIEHFNFDHAGIDFRVDVICYNEYSAFEDEWKMTDDHKGGVTVQNPDAGRNSYKFAIPLNYSLAERMRDLAARGDDNPSANAYQAAQDALQRDINASDYGFQVSASIGNVELLDSVTLGCSFDYSYHDDGDLLSNAEEVFNENEIKGEAIEAAIKAAGGLLANMDTLKKLVDTVKESA